MILNNFGRNIKFIFHTIIISIIISSCINHNPGSIPEIINHFDNINDILVMHIDNIEYLNDGSISFDILANVDSKYVLDTSIILNGELYAYDNNTKNWSLIKKKSIIRYYYLGNYEENGLYGSPILPTGAPLVIQPLPTAYYLHLSEDQIFDAKNPNMKIVVVDDNQKIWLDGKLYQIPGYEFKISYDVNLLQNKELILILSGNLLENDVVTEKTVATYELFNIK